MSKLKNFKFLTEKKTKTNIEIFTEVLNFPLNDYLRNLDLQRIERVTHTIGGGSRMFYESQNVIHTILRNNELLNEMLNYTPNET